MKRLFLPVFITLAFLVVVGCGQRKVSQGMEQPAGGGQAPLEIKPEARTDEAPKPVHSEEIMTKPLPKETVKETVAEAGLPKAAQAGVRPSAAELQAKVRDIHFDFDKYDVRDDAKPVLREVSDMLTANRGVKVVLEGHCDDRGTNEYNLGLGDRRANSAKEYLMSLGVPADRTETVSYGEEKPLCPETTEECRAANRRTHFVLIEEK